MECYFDFVVCILQRIRSIRSELFPAEDGRPFCGLDVFLSHAIHRRFRAHHFSVLSSGQYGMQISNAVQLFDTTSDRDEISFEHDYAFGYSDVDGVCPAAACRAFRVVAHIQFGIRSINVGFFCLKLHRHHILMVHNNLLHRRDDRRSIYPEHD